MQWAWNLLLSQAVIQSAKAGSNALSRGFERPLCWLDAALFYVGDHLGPLGKGLRLACALPNGPLDVNRGGLDSTSASREGGI